MRKTLVVIGVLAGSFAAGVAWAAVELAKVNGKAITEADLELALSGMNEAQRRKVLRDGQSRLQILDNVIKTELLVQQAEREKLENTPEYKRAFAAFRREALATLLVDRKFGSKLTDSEARRFYETYKHRFTTDRVHAMHILLGDEASARRVLAEAKKAGDFQSLAEKYSIAPGKENTRGDLGYFGWSDMVPEFAEAAFKAKAGEIIGPVKTVYGYHVIRVVAKKPGKTLEFHEVELQVKNALRHELMQGYVGDLRSKADVKVNKTAFK